MTVALSRTATEPLYWAQTEYDVLKTGAVIAGSSFVRPITKLFRRYATYKNKLNVFSQSVIGEIHVCQITATDSSLSRCRSICQWRFSVHGTCLAHPACLLNSLCCTSDSQSLRKSLTFNKSQNWWKYWMGWLCQHSFQDRARHVAMATNFRS